MRGLSFALLCALLAAAGCGGASDPLPAAGSEAPQPVLADPLPAPDPSPAPAVTDAGRIVFAASHDTGTVGAVVTNVFSIRPDGTGLHQVTNNTSWSVGYVDPIMSGDRRWVVATASADGGPFWITVANADGSGERVITETREDAGYASLHPDGEQVIFASRCCDWSALYVVDIDGTDRRRLSDTPGFDYSPAVSPGGGQIAFVSQRDGNPEIYVMNRDGSDQRRLTAVPAADLMPAFSPDNGRIAFVSRRDGALNVYIMKWDGSAVAQLTSDGGAAPVFSPDGQYIAFEASGGRIHVASPDGTGRRDLAAGRHPAFSPDSRSVAFLGADAAGRPAILAVNVDGTALRRVTDPTHGVSPYGGPDWK